ncbi:flagellar filament capping protein FliD [Paractinoplanes deccanensis]|uniref:flagellar filament capping protein FliD n=1 Tax=Paractinoplanes deccanensis TaxID=113561 RepID=UPI0019443D6D|nr:flagellar filament capping protein FliD [Actinoplanes deccanensis]
MSTSVDGLVSGLSTSSLITQLMQVEAAPQTRLKTKVSTAETAVSSYQSVNSKLKAIKTAAEDIGKLATWRAVSPKSSSATVTATSTGGTNTASGTTIFNVGSLASNQISTAKVAKDGDITSASTVELTVGGVAKTVTLGEDKTAQGVADSINAAGIGVKAVLVTTGGNENILQLSGTKTGAEASFSVDSGLESLNLVEVAQAKDARLDIGGGDGVDGGYSVRSSTNTFTTLMPGVSITVSKMENDVTVTADSDVSGMAAKMQALVDAVNGTLTEVASQTKYDATTKKGSPLTGDFMVRNMSQAFLSKISLGLTYDNPVYDETTNPGVDKTLSTTLAKLGVELDRSGQLTFNSNTFKAKYNEDPTQFQAAAIAFGDQMRALADDQSRNVTSVITGRNNEIDSLNLQIENWDIRLAARKSSLQKQYSDLEVSLGKLKEQSNWLAGQLAGLG